MKTQVFKLELGGRELIVEIKNAAEQASGSCFIRYGDTLVLITSVMSEMTREDQGFFPLTVEYEERYYAAGKIKGPRYIKRESRPSDKAICNARLIDRAIRPLFPKGLKREVQVVATVLSWDNQNDPDILGLIGASLSLLISDIPWSGPVAALKIGWKNNEFILNPTYQEKEESSLEIVFAATKQNELLLNMIEGEGNETEEEIIYQAWQFAKTHLEKIVAFQKEIAQKIGKEKMAIAPEEIDAKLEEKMRNFLGAKLEQAIYQKTKEERVNNVWQLKNELIDFVAQEDPSRKNYAQKFFDNEIDRLVHKNILEKELRPDNRKLDEIRELSFEVGLLPRTHGSALFCRGETHALSILTLGAPGDQQILEGMEITGKKRFMHHYNFPPYSTGEVKPMRGPGRREIGHGMLAEKALMPLIPSFDEFPYTIRIVSEILSSNGSTSMASASSASLSLMDAGVPIKTAVTGIALGLMSDEKGNYKILTDIQGPEDLHGDMDFKIAGTKNGITGLQMDVKITGITEKILKETLEKGKKARGQILEEMAKVINKPRPELSPFAPRILTMQINPDRIRDVIGPGGKVINEIIKECGAAIDIEDDGKIFITGEREEAAQKAVDWIKNITREAKVGEIFQGKVRRILNFGAFVEIFPGTEGMVHISQLAPWRVEKVEDIVKIGDTIPVKVISIDEQGRINLSLKETGKYDKQSNK